VTLLRDDRRGETPNDMVGKAVCGLWEGGGKESDK
jgi:hypothetical protein